MQLWKEHLGLLEFNGWDQLLVNEPEQDQHQHHPHQNNYGPNQRFGDKFASHVSDLGVGQQPHRSNIDDIRLCESSEPVRVLDNTSRSCSLYDTFRTQHSQYIKRADAAALDPLSYQCYNNLWHRTAENNTFIYRDLFRCVPDDTVHTFDQHRNFVPPKSVPYGHIANPELNSGEIRTATRSSPRSSCPIPSDYLKDENLLGSHIVESMPHMILFT